MSREPLLDSLIAELNQALVALQSARKVAAELQQATATARRAVWRGDRDAVVAASPSLRYGGMTVSEAASVLDLGDEQIRRMLRSGQLPGVSFGGRVGWRINREYVESIATAWEQQRAAEEAARRNRRKRPSGPVVPRPGQR